MFLSNKIRAAVNYNDPNSLGNRLRNKRFELFYAFLTQYNNSNSTLTILDVGGTENFWINRGFHKRDNIKITLVNLFPQTTQYDHITALQGNATNLSMFDKKQFDIVFSNSVIEHVSTFSNQQKMAQEIQRVGHKYFIQTPNKYFVIEPHFLFPLFQFLPKRLKYIILTKTKLANTRKWPPDVAEKVIREVRLLSKREIKGLFKDGQLYKEKIGGLTKSFIVHNFETSL